LEKHDLIPSLGLGPLSVTVHIPLPTSSSKSSSPTLYSSLLTLHTLVTNSPALAARTDIHLVLSPFPRAFNAWRNLARLLARTTYMLLLDVDFAVCTDWRAPVRALLRDGVNPVAKRVREGSAALVLPAFEYMKQAEGRDQGVFPRDKHVCHHFESCPCFPFHLLMDFPPSPTGPLRLGTRESYRPFPRVLCCWSQQHRLSPILRRQAWRDLQGDAISASIRAIRNS
jgi:hypothetical protein